MVMSLTMTADPTTFPPLCVLQLPQLTGRPSGRGLADHKRPRDGRATARPRPERTPDRSVDVYSCYCSGHAAKGFIRLRAYAYVWSHRVSPEEAGPRLGTSGRCYLCTCPLTHQRGGKTVRQLSSVDQPLRPTTKGKVGITSSSGQSDRT